MEKIVVTKMYAYKSEATKEIIPMELADEYTAPSRNNSIGLLTNESKSICAVCDFSQGDEEAEIIGVFGVSNGTIMPVASIENLL